ncbi:MAG: glycosyl transferase [Treponema sp.]|jgi:hypothetical protein|nr:glycosyl transferase [Treponema sp.]
MATWKEKLPDYELILWNTKHFDTNSVLWVKQAFEAELYACAADYIRLYAVYNYGGIYLDMDMEVVKPFDGLLNSELILAYENHINENIEAGCFGAAINHPYIKKCMEYFEKTPFFDPSLRTEVMSLPRTKRHKFVDPLILPEIMKNAAKEFFNYGGFKFYSRDYFTAKNIVTGKIETTNNTFTIHNFSSLYHSEEWLKIRNTERKIYAVLGRTIIAKLGCHIYVASWRVKKHGFFKAIKYYVDRFILRKIPAEII